ncbi:MAG: MBOAT family O-acyltransferase, partial [Candidatus Paceibacterales bacterium]
LIPLKLQKYFLLISGCFFYAFMVPWHLLILAAIITGNFFYGRLAGRTDRGKLYLILIIIFNLGVLSLFKYYNFFNSNIEAFAQLIGWNYSIPALKLALPIGISFYTFKCLSYDVEVYRKNIPGEKRFGIFSLYILIYPELLSGPIDRPQNIIPQLETGHAYDYEKVTSGLKLMAWGFFQKWVIADRLAPLVNHVYDNVYAFNGLSYVVATFFFAFQIYCDFAAYSDIAIGAGEVLGFKFMKNFDRPYFSKSLSEFFHRWHISLSTWLRDYLYTPLAIGTRSWGTTSVVFSLTVTFVLAGIWHGARMTFVIFGALYGIGLGYEVIAKRFNKKLAKTLPTTVYDLVCNFTTFGYVCFAWIFFRSNSIKEALYIVKNLYTGFHSYINILFQFHWAEIIKPLSLGMGPMDLYLALVFISFLLAVHLFQRKTSIRYYVSQKPFVVRWALYLTLILIILI